MIIRSPSNRGRWFVQVTIARRPAKADDRLSQGEAGFASSDSTFVIRKATAVVFPAWDGEVGVLPQRAPFLFEMGIGVLRVDTPEGKQTLYVEGGFAQMVGDKLTLLTEGAKRLDELDRGKAEAALAAARELPMLTDAEFEARQKAI